jgi:Leucine-rich repeat (LRR) protein
MYKNNMTGSIPEELGDLKQLGLLQLWDSGSKVGMGLEGPIPEALGNLKQLTYLRLDGNQIEGTIPAALGGLEQLVYLNLQNNRLNGTIPETLADLKQLVQLYLSNSMIEGSIPAWLAGLERLTGLGLYRNRLTGVVPSLPFKNYTNCYLQVNPSPSNHFTCPLPPVSPCINPPLRAVRRCSDRLSRHCTRHPSCSTCTPTHAMV